MNNIYPKAILDAAKLLVKELAKTYSKILEQTYDSAGYPSDDPDKSSFEERMQMGIYMELLKAGIRFDD